MKLGVFNPILSGMPFEDAMKYLADSGVQAVEIGCGGFPGKAHCDPAVLLNDEAELEKFKAVLEKNHLEISALSTHGNAVLNEIYGKIRVVGSNVRNKRAAANETRRRKKSF